MEDKGGCRGVLEVVAGVGGYVNIPRIHGCEADHITGFKGVGNRGRKFTRGTGDGEGKEGRDRGDDKGDHCNRHAVRIILPPHQSGAGRAVKGTGRRGREGGVGVHRKVKPGELSGRGGPWHGHKPRYIATVAIASKSDVAVAIAISSGDVGGVLVGVGLQLGDPAGDGGDLGEVKGGAHHQATRQRRAPGHNGGPGSYGRGRVGGLRSGEGYLHRGLRACTKVAKCAH